MSMNKIRNYVENSFASLPRTKEIAEVKMNIIESMEERYETLLAEGKNENEALGAVIAEFGSIDEIRQELGITEEQIDSPLFEETPSHAIPEDLLRAYAAFRSQFAIAITAGVILCILAVVMCQVFQSIFGNGTISIVVFFLLIAAAVGLFVYYGMQKSYWEEQIAYYQSSSLPDSQLTPPSAVKKKESLSERLSGAIMLLATAFFLLIGFLFDMWHPGWIVFPIAGILCGVIKVLIGDKS